MVSTLVAVLADGGRMVLTGPSDDPVATTLGALEHVHVEPSPIRSGRAFEVSIR